MAFFFSRDTKVFMTHSLRRKSAKTALYEIPVLDGFSFSQGTNTSEVTLNEAATSRWIFVKEVEQCLRTLLHQQNGRFQPYMRPTTSGSAAPSAATDGVTHGQHAGSS